MEFKKFSKIENSYRQKSIHRAQIEFPKEKYIVQEKVHGANFSFHYSNDEKVIKCAKRSGYIKPKEKFHNYEKLLDKYSKNILKSFKIAKEKLGCESFSIFGEIYGGSYPHEDVEKLKVSKVQKGVFYNNDVDFIAFDIKVNDEYIDYNEFISLCLLGDIPFLPALETGTLTECLQYPNEFNSTIPLMHNLPEIENNICEGVVIRPFKTIRYDNGERVIFKNKNQKFTEKENTKKQNKEPIKEMPLYLSKTCKDSNQYINENRLRNVLSKIGEITQKDFGKILGLFCKDVVEDFSKDNEDYEHLKDSEIKIVNKYINKNCSILIRNNFLNIIDGEF